MVERVKQVLVVDDEEGMRDMLTLLLSREGFDVKAASSGDEALEQIHSGGVDIVLADVRMPGMDGLALLQRIVDLKLPVTVIMMSAYVDHDTAIEALKTGALDYISKPFKTDEVVLKIKLAEERIRLSEEREQLKNENEKLKQKPSGNRNGLGLAEKFIGKSKKVGQIINTVGKIADYKSTVLVTGESGTGKEIVARALHDLSSRAANPFIPINCGAIPETLLESELFGYVRGAFTDARRDKKGLIEEAHGGTLFLDEIGELPGSLQVKLLRFLQEEEIRRVGDTKGRQVDVRVIAATAVDLAKATETGTFREDLFYRLNVLQIAIPPLRERKEDIPLLAEHFMGHFSKKLNREVQGLTREAMRALMDFHWPGNVRELENCIERSVVLSDQALIDMAALPEKLQSTQKAGGFSLGDDELSIKRSARKLERELIRRALERTGGNRTRAAHLLEISHRALLYKIKEYQLT